MTDHGFDDERHALRVQLESLQIELDAVSRAMTTRTLERNALRETLDLADWYIRCLEDAQDGRIVRGLTEAKLGWTNARHAVAANGK